MQLTRRHKFDNVELANSFKGRNLAKQQREQKLLQALLAKMKCTVNERNTMQHLRHQTTSDRKSSIHKSPTSLYEVLSMFSKSLNSIMRFIANERNMT